MGSDLTYVKVKNKWHYICVFIDLFNREIIGFSTGPNKDTQLTLEFGDYVNWFNEHPKEIPFLKRVKGVGPTVGRG